MRSKTGTFFEVRARYEKTSEDGFIKKVTETYIVEAMSFSEAENRAIEELSHYVSGELDIVGIKIAPFREIIFSGEDQDEYWFKVKAAFITFNEKTGREKRSKSNFFVNGSNIEKASRNFNALMSGTMIDYEIVSINDTQTIDVFEFTHK